MRTTTTVIASGFVLLASVRPTTALPPCVCDVNGDEAVTIAELIQGINAATLGCAYPPTPVPSPTLTAAPVPTPSPVIVACGDEQTVPLTLTQAAGCQVVRGTLQGNPDVSLLGRVSVASGCAAFPQPAPAGSSGWAILCDQPLPAQVTPFLLRIRLTKSTVLHGTIDGAFNGETPPKRCSASMLPIPVTCR